MCQDAFSGCTAPRKEDVHMMKQLMLYPFLWLLGLSMLFLVERVMGHSIGDTIVAFYSNFPSASIEEMIVMILLACAPIAAPFFSLVSK